MYIVGGFRYRIVYLILSLGTIYHLYPRSRRINYPVVIIVAIVAFFGFAIMDKSRVYGTGIDREAAKEVSLKDAEKGAGESANVCCFSIIVIDEYSRWGGYVYFEPIINAILMPIPRAIFPWKPDGQYMRVAQLRTIGSFEGGAACLCFVEAFMAFGWLGVLLYGLFMGWMSRLFWDNYQRNRNSMGAILLLALYNGFCYQWISRGYMGGNFNSFLYYVFVPFWMTALFRLMMPKYVTR